MSYTSKNTYVHSPPQTSQLAAQQASPFGIPAVPRPLHVSPGRVANKKQAARV